MSSQEATPVDGVAPPTGASLAWDDAAARERHRGLADRLIALANPKTALDLGCGAGLLVQALAERGVDAHGLDADEAAFDSAHPEVRARLDQHPGTRPLPGRYDLVTCLDVVERTDPTSAQALIDSMCAATDRVVFVSSPDAFDDPAHVNVHPTSEWAAAFAERGFFRRTDVNLDFLDEHAVLLERADLQPRDIVHRYESRLAPLGAELRERREALARLQRQRASGDRVAELEEELRRARHDVLTTRDHIIGLEAETTQLQGQVDRLTNRLAVQQTRVQKLRTRLANQQRRANRAERTLEQVRTSRAWRLARRLSRGSAPEL